MADPTYDPKSGKWDREVAYDLRYLVAATGREDRVVRVVTGINVHDALRRLEAACGPVLALDCHPVVPVR